MAREQEANLQTICAIFGTCYFEAEFPGVIGSQLGPGANPWARQFFNDIKGLGAIDSGQALLEQIGDDILRFFLTTLFEKTSS